MSYQVLARKWRPKSFADMVGQGHVLKALANALDSGRLHHAYLFTGTRGVGKTTLARIIAKCLNCERGVSSTPCGECSACKGIDEGRFVDLIEVDAASRAKVDETRELMDNVQYAPTAARYKVYLIDEVHMFSSHSFNALLKTLEEPPPHVKFLLATTEPRKLPVTILSRCLQFNLKHLSTEQIASQLASIAERESLQADPASLQLIAVAANGSMRDALSLLDQAIAYCDGALKEEPVREMLGTIDSTELTGLLRSLFSGDGADLLARTERMAGHNPDFDAILAELLARLHDIAVVQAVPGGAASVDGAARELASLVPPEDVQLYYQIALNGRRDLHLAPDPRMGFQMTLVRMLAFRPAPEAGSAAPAASTQGGEAPRATPRAAPARAAPAPAAVTGNDWQSLMAALSLDGAVREFAGHCTLREFSGNRMHLVLTPSHGELLNTRLRDRLQEAVHARFGTEVKLVISVEEPAEETPAQRAAREARERQAAALKAIETDPGARALMDAFDATLDRNSVRPN